MIKQKFMAKSEYAKANLYQSFLDMKCLKRGDICKFLNNLSTKCHELKVIGITITNINYQHTILCSMPTSNILTTLTITSEVIRKPVNMEKLTAQQHLQ